MLPLNERWYRLLLVWAVGLGLAGGLIALLYSGATGAAIDWIFGDPLPDSWSGSWWWILVVPCGALCVTALRRLWDVADDVPGAIALASRGWVEPSSALPWVLISVVSLAAGASLGPSFGIVVAGGGLGAYVFRRSGATDTEEADQHHALTGMAGGLGALFSAPLFATILGNELSSTSKRKYVEAFIPQFTAATFGYIVFFGITGTVMLDAFNVGEAYQPYEFAVVDLFVGVVLGVCAVVTLVAYIVVDRVLGMAADRITNPWFKALLLGLVIGTIAYALPLTATGGSSQLAFVTGSIGTIASGLLLLVLIGKMAAIVLSLQAGFLGGTVFPMLFIGGTAGVLVHQLFPGIPAALAVASMIAAVPGATIGAPVSFILIGTAGVGIGVEAVGPIGIAVLTAYVTTAGLRSRITKRKELDRAHGSG